MASAYAHRIPHNPTSNLFASGPQIFLNSSEFHPNGKLTQLTIIEIAAKIQRKKNILSLNSLKHKSRVN